MKRNTSDCPYRRRNTDLCGTHDSLSILLLFFVVPAKVKYASQADRSRLVILPENHCDIIERSIFRRRTVYRCDLKVAVTTFLLHQISEHKSRKKRNVADLLGKTQRASTKGFILVKKSGDVGVSKE